MVVGGCETEALAWMPAVHVLAKGHQLAAWGDRKMGAQAGFRRKNARLSVALDVHRRRHDSVEDQDCQHRGHLENDSRWLVRSKDASRPATPVHQKRRREMGGACVCSVALDFAPLPGCDDGDRVATLDPLAPS